MEPVRKVFYIDVGRMSHSDAIKHIKRSVAKHKHYTKRLLEEERRGQKL